MRDYKVDEQRKAIKLKKQQIEELKNSLKDYKSFIIINLKKVPDKLLQSSRKKLKEKQAFAKVSKLTVLKRALKDLNLPEEFYNDVEFPAMVIGVNDSPYSLAQFFSSNMMDMPAKEGDVADKDIVVEAGETDLQPGPALSQLKVAGVNVKIDKGKIVVAKDSVVVKAGETVTKEKASVLQLLGLKPFKAGLKIYKAYDGETLFDEEVLLIKPEEVEESIKDLFSKGYNLSVNSNYPTEENVKLLLNKAFSNERNLSLNSNYPTKEFINDLILKALMQANAIKIEGG